MLKQAVLLIVVFIFGGCMSLKQEVVYEEYKKPEIIEKKYEEDTPKKIIVKNDQKNLQMIFKSGIVKGVVSSVSYDGKWRYDVVGSDTTNGKLSHARFYSDKKAFSKGDEVYAIFKNSILKEFYLLKKANIKTKTNLKKQKAKVKKSTTKTKKLIKKDNIKGKKHKVLSVPITESIELD